MLYIMVKQGLSASRYNQMLTVNVSLTLTFPSLSLFPYSLVFSSLLPLLSPLHIFPTCILSSPSSSLHISSAPSGGSVASDAAGRGQPVIFVAGGNLQTTLRQEGH